MGEGIHLSGMGILGVIEVRLECRWVRLGCRCVAGVVEPWRGASLRCGWGVVEWRVSLSHGEGWVHVFERKEGPGAFIGLEWVSLRYRNGRIQASLGCGGVAGVIGVSLGRC